MANLQQLDVVKPQEIQDTIGHLMTKGFLGGVPMPVHDIPVDASVLEHGASGASSTVDGLSAHALSHGATIIPGPPEGGALLERPVGSFLAEHASDQSLGLEQYMGAEGPTYLARRIAGAGEMQVAGVDFNVIDFVPGGDLVQMVAGEKFNPSGIMMALAKGRMEAEVVHGHLLHRETDHERAVREQDQARLPTIDDNAGNGVTGEPARGAGHASRFDSERQNPQDLDGNGAKDPMNDDSSNAVTDEPVPAGQTPANGRRRAIDSDTAARDLAMLGQEHARNLDNAVSQWDEHDVHTEVTLHGRKLEIDTHFDAHNPDNRKERDLAEDHAKHIPDAQNKETVTEGSRMAFRSQVHAHLEAQARDEGMAR